MVRLRMRTRLLLSLMLVSVGLTSATLMLVHRVIERQARKEIFQDLHNSLSTFQNLERQRQLTLYRTARLMADLPNVRALMTTEHPTTIQDGSQDLLRLAGTDLLVLSGPGGDLMALHVSRPGLTRGVAEKALRRSLPEGHPDHWWFGDDHLYEVSIQPIYFGPPSGNRLLGFLVVGYEIDDPVAQEISQVAASQVAFQYGDEVVRSTLSLPAKSQFPAERVRSGGAFGLDEVQLGQERFLVESVELVSRDSTRVRLSVLKSLDQATAFLTRLNSTLLGVGFILVLVGGGLVYLISYRFTRPLGLLVRGVRALEGGDYSYPLPSDGGDEVTELTSAFRRMRTSLRDTQARLLDAERLATIGRMASSISHDLRHCLAAIMANAEFLSETSRNAAEREELYLEVRIAVSQMTDLLDSLLELSRSRDSLRVSEGRLTDVIRQSVHDVRGNPEFHHVEITVQSESTRTSYFDAKKLERAFQNLIRNACEAVPAQGGKVEITIDEGEDRIKIRIEDNGHGIPESICGHEFEPFVSEGKANGTGLGLTIVQKIIEDHRGEVLVEQTSPQGTTILVLLPRAQPVRAVSEAACIVPGPVLSQVLGGEECDVRANRHSSQS